MLKRILSIACFGLLVGSLASLASVAFVEAVLFLNELLMSSPTARKSAPDSGLLYVLALVVPALGGLIVGLLCRTIPEKRPHNLSDTIESAQTLREDTSLKSGLTTALAGVIAIGSGASVGQYGPVAHLGATLGSWISQYTRQSGFTGVMGIGCGAAAAIATVFNAPIAGLIFAHEVILRHYSLKAFAPITVSSVTGYLIANYLFELDPIFEIGFLTPIQAPEFLVFVVIGIVGAILAVGFVRLVLISGKLATQLPGPAYIRPALAGTILGLVSLQIPEVLGVGQEVFRNALLPAYTEWELVTILFAKLVVTALCLGFGFAGGIFSPALLIGVVFGSLIGGLVPDIMIEHFSSVAVYSICGMVAVTSPVVGAPLTIIIIVFELTRNYELTIAAMITVVFANLIGYRLMGRSIFDTQLGMRGFDLSLGRDRVVLDSRALSEFLSNDFVSVSPETSVGILLDKLTREGKSEGYIVDAENNYVGTVTALQLASMNRSPELLNRPCRDVMERESIVFTLDTTIWSAMENIQHFVGESIPVVTGDNKDNLEGVVYESTVIKAYMDTLYNIRREEHAAD